MIIYCYFCILLLLIELIQTIPTWSPFLLCGSDEFPLQMRLAGREKNLFKKNNLGKNDDVSII